MIEGLIFGVVIGVWLVTLFILAYPRWKAMQTPQQKTEEEPRFESREFDVNNPPKFMTYRPKPDKPALKCTNPGCYRPLSPGEKVLIWPVKHAHGSYDIYCNTCVALGKN